MQLRVESVDTVFSDGKHNAFTSICYWRGKYYIGFRSSLSHASPHEDGWQGTGLKGGCIRIIESSDLKSWSDSIVIDTEWDDRDAALLATENRLFLYAASMPPDGKEQTFVSYTEDGAKWTGPVKAYQSGLVFWRPKTHQGAYYVASDAGVKPKEASVEEWGRVELLRSTDGLNWENVSTITSGNCPTETEIVFLNDSRLLAVVRQNLVALAQPPYTQWNYHKIDVHDLRIGFPGPAAVQVGNTVIIICRALCDDSVDLAKTPIPDCVTAVYSLDLETMHLQKKLELPSRFNGDLSYAGILPLAENRLLISHYDGEKYEKGIFKRADIRLAEIGIE